MKTRNNLTPAYSVISNFHTKLQKTTSGCTCVASAGTKYPFLTSVTGITDDFILFLKVMSSMFDEPWT